MVCGNFWVWWNHAFKAFEGAPGEGLPGALELLDGLNSSQPGRPHPPRKGSHPLHPLVLRGCNGGVVGWEVWVIGEGGGRRRCEWNREEVSDAMGRRTHHNCEEEFGAAHLWVRRIRYPALEVDGSEGRRDPNSGVLPQRLA